MHLDSNLPESATDSRRDFMKKLALGAAWVAPTVATFSLDSIRSVAHAQESGVRPTVTLVAADSNDIGVIFSTFMDHTKKCIEITGNPAFTPGTFVERWILSKGGDASAYLVTFDGGSPYSGVATIKINTSDMGCHEFDLVTDIYGNKLAPYSHVTGPITP